MKPQQQPNENQPYTGPNYVVLFCAFMALAPELLLHDPRTFGIRSVRPRGGGTVLTMYIFAICYTNDDRTPLLWLTLITALLVIFAYLWAVLRERRGQVCHSYYNGRPWVLSLLPVSEEWMKRAEPLLIVVAGWGLHHWNCPVGSFIVTAGACHGFRIIVQYLSTRGRTLDFNDAMVEQTVAMQALKRMRRR
jgi:hypothetical protein